MLSPKKRARQLHRSLLWKIRNYSKENRKKSQSIVDAVVWKQKNIESQIFLPAHMLSSTFISYVLTLLDLLIMMGKKSFLLWITTVRIQES